MLCASPAFSDLKLSVVQEHTYIWFNSIYIILFLTSYFGIIFHAFNNIHIDFSDYIQFCRVQPASCTPLFSHQRIHSVFSYSLSQATEITCMKVPHRSGFSTLLFGRLLQRSSDLFLTCSLWITTPSSFQTAPACVTLWPLCHVRLIQEISLLNMTQHSFVLGLSLLHDIQ